MEGGICFLRLRAQRQRVVGMDDEKPQACVNIRRGKAASSGSIVDRHRALATDAGEREEYWRAYGRQHQAWHKAKDGQQRRGVAPDDRAGIISASC